MRIYLPLSVIYRKVTFRTFQIQNIVQMVVPLKVSSGILKIGWQANSASGVHCREELPPLEVVSQEESSSHAGSVAYNNVQGGMCHPFRHF